MHEKSQIPMQCKYKNKHVTLYQLCSGNSFTVKVRSSTLEQRPIGSGNIIKSFGFSRQGKWSKTADGQWVQSTEQFDDFLIKFAVAQNFQPVRHRLFDESRIDEKLEVDDGSVLEVVEIAYVD